MRGDAVPRAGESFAIATRFAATADAVAASPTTPLKNPPRSHTSHPTNTKQPTKPKQKQKQFYKKIQADPLVAPFFDGVDMKKQKAKQMQFMALAFGGPNDYKGKAMGPAHAALALSDEHFDAVAGHFVATLTELGVDPQVVGEAAAVVLSTKDEVLQRGPGKKE